jgi:hypothetical protein
MDDRPRFVLEVEALPDERPWPIRLRLVLKDLLRREGFRCRSIRRADGPAATQPGEKGEPDA